MKLSIIIATYNASRCLKSCLDSIVPQMNPDTELIVVDGGSTDGTQAIVLSYGDRIGHFISEKDRGIYDAWNKGVRLSSADWVMFVGADDRLLPKAVERYLSLAEKFQDCDYICARNNYLDDSGRVVSVLGSAPEWERFRKAMVAVHVGSLHKRSLFNEVGEYDLSFRICADYELLLRKREKLKWHFQDEIMAEMKIGGVSFSMAAIREAYRIRKFRFENIKARLREWITGQTNEFPPEF